MTKIRPQDENYNLAWIFRRHFVATFRQPAVTYRENARAAQTTAVR